MQTAVLDTTLCGGRILGETIRTDGATAGWFFKDAGEKDYRHDDHGVMVLFSPVPLYETRVNGTRRAVMAPAGTVEIKPAGSDIWARWDRQMESAYFALTPPRMEALARSEFGRDGARLLYRGIFRDDAVQRLADGAREEFRRGLMTAERVDSLATLIGVHLLRRHSTLSDRPFDVPRLRGGLAPHVRRAVMDYIDANLSRPLPLEDLALVAGLAPTYFLRAFRQETGLTPHQYVLSQRVAAAERLLIRGEDSLAEIAVAAGFASQSHMTTVFGKVRGRTPGSYRHHRAPHLRMAG